MDQSMFFLSNPNPNTMNKAISHNVDSFTAAYIVAALWSSTDDQGEPLDLNFDLDNISDAAFDSMVADCEEFQRVNAELLSKFYEHRDAARAGNNFWLNRNGHGSGFWDEFMHSDPEGTRELGAKLSEACKCFGECNLYEGDPEPGETRGKLYLSPVKKLTS